MLLAADTFPAAGATVQSGSAQAWVAQVPVPEQKAEVHCSEAVHATPFARVATHAPTLHQAPHAQFAVVLQVVGQLALTPLHT